MDPILPLFLTPFSGARICNFFGDFSSPPEGLTNFFYTFLDIQKYRKVKICRFRYLLVARFWAPKSKKRFFFWRVEKFLRGDHPGNHHFWKTGGSYVFAFCDFLICCRRIFEFLTSLVFYFLFFYFLKSGFCKPPTPRHPRGPPAGVSAKLPPTPKL